MARAEHGPGVLDGRKGRKGLGADALAGRVGGDQVEGACSSRIRSSRMRASYSWSVITGVVEHVVAMVVEIEGALKLGVAVGGSWVRHSWDIEWAPYWF